MNDIVAVGAESFYATNHKAIPNDALNFLIILLGLPWCDVVYYSPKEVRVAANGFMSSNGINISPDKRSYSVQLFSQFHRKIYIAKNQNCDAFVAGIFMFLISWTMR